MGVLHPLQKVAIPYSFDPLKLRLWSRGTWKSAECEIITRILGQTPKQCPRTETMVRGSACQGSDVPSWSFLLLSIRRQQQICALSVFCRFAKWEVCFHLSLLCFHLFLVYWGNLTYGWRWRSHIYVLSTWVHYIWFVLWVGPHGLCVTSNWAPGCHFRGGFSTSEEG